MKLNFNDRRDSPQIHRSRDPKTDDYKCSGLPLRSYRDSSLPPEDALDFLLVDESPLTLPSVDHSIIRTIEETNRIMERLEADRDDYLRKFQKEQKRNDSLAAEIDSLQSEIGTLRRQLVEKPLAPDVDATSLKLIEKFEREMVVTRDRSLDLAEEVTQLKVKLAKSEEAAKHELSLARSKIKALEDREDKWREKLAKYKDFYDSTRRLRRQEGQNEENERYDGQNGQNGQNKDYNRNEIPVVVSDSTGKSSKSIDVVRNLFPQRTRSDDPAPLYEQQNHFSSGKPQQKPFNINTNPGRPVCEACKRQIHRCADCNEPHTYSPENTFNDPNAFKWPSRETKA